jgi:hypothetical protein
VNIILEGDAMNVVQAMNLEEMNWSHFGHLIGDTTYEEGYALRACSRLHLRNKVFKSKCVFFTKSSILSFCRNYILTIFRLFDIQKRFTKLLYNIYIYIYI